MKKNLTTSESLHSPWELAATMMTPVRWVLGWMFFSAFWRRAVLAPVKMDPNSPNYVGHKMNAFLPHAFLIKPMLTYLFVHPSAFHGFMLIFTLIEGLCGLVLILGFFTRLSSLGITLLSWGILFGSGWMGSTCLDEWQIGTMGVAGGLILMITGSGLWSLDHLWQRKYPQIGEKTWLKLLGSGDFSSSAVKRVTLTFSIVAFALTLFTNQLFFSGVWGFVGKLHNFSKQPNIALSRTTLGTNGTLKLQVYRNGGPDTYGSFVVAIAVKNSSGKVVERYTPKQLAQIKPNQIKNGYPNKVKAGKFALIVPLGAKAQLSLAAPKHTTLQSGNYTVTVADVSGLHWTTTTTVH